MGEQFDTRVANDAGEQRYVITLDGVPAGYAQYRDEPGRRVFVHTVVYEDFADQGLGSALARSALDDTRAAGLTVVPSCPFIRAYIARHAEYGDLLG